MILVTGGAGFIGSNFARSRFAASANGIEGLVNLDKLTYAGNRQNLRGIESDPRYVFVRGEIGNAPLVKALLEKYRPRALVNFAAESHVDRSIVSADEFIQTNVLGTLNLLQNARAYWESLPLHATEFGVVGRDNFRFLHISTDEVYGSLRPNDAPFTEESLFRPNSPYAASKAASDHLVRAWHHTYGLPVLTINCSNNYGPHQFPEKLIPLVIVHALEGKPLPIYGDGLNIRDWLYVEDHCRAIAAVLESGKPGETYNIGGFNQKTNLDVVRTICALLDDERPRADRASYAAQITFVADRAGHDRRYAVDARKSARELGWKPVETFESGMRKTVRWYLLNQDWVRDVTSGKYREWIASQRSTR